MEKVIITKKIVDYARSVSPDILVEGELGYLKGSSQVQTKIEITPADFTKPEEAREFVEKTGVNQLAVVFGNIHGIVTDQEEKLDIEHFKKECAHYPELKNTNIDEIKQTFVHKKVEIIELKKYKR